MTSAEVFGTASSEYRSATDQLDDPKTLTQACKESFSVTTMERGFTLVELLTALAIAALLFAALSGIVGESLQRRDVAHERNELSRQAAFAMERMVYAVSHTRLLLLPLNDNPASGQAEHIRAVLSVSLPLSSDQDGNGVPDADNDGDGRIDEDLPDDTNNDLAPGIYGIDDDGDGAVDENSTTEVWNDDESGGINEDRGNGVDDDGDGTTDEDLSGDMNGDGCPGVCGVDDDGDGAVDENPVFGIGDDDEDGQTNEDWLDAVVFYVASGVLKERTPVPWDESGIGGITGRDFVVSDLAEGVSQFRVERIAQVNDRALRVDLTLALTSAVTGETVSLQTQVRVGSAP